jgi:hypothetical protein
MGLKCIFGSVPPRGLKNSVRSPFRLTTKHFVTDPVPCPVDE